MSLLIHKKETFYWAVGASGGVTGILFAAIAAFPEMELRLFFALPIPAWIFGILYLGYSVYGMKTNLGNMGHSAHLGGAIVGIIIAILFLSNDFTNQYVLYFRNDCSINCIICDDFTRTSKIKNKT